MIKHSNPKILGACHRPKEGNQPLPSNNYSKTCYRNGCIPEREGAIQWISV
jgi:hypothetical protein